MTKTRHTYTSPNLFGRMRDLQRETNFRTNRDLSLSGRLQSDFFHQQILIPAGIKIDFQIVLSHTALYIKTAVPGKKPPVLSRLELKLASSFS